MLTALYDACVLYPAPLRDLLLQLATTGLFRAKWTDAIHEEWMRNVLKNRRDLTRDQLERTRRLMNAGVADCLVDGYQHLIETIALPDDDDRHVVAAAVFAKADVIVTVNLRDFPARALMPHNLAAVHPDDFISSQLALDTVTVTDVVRTCCSRLRNPPKTVEDYLRILEAQQLRRSVAGLAEYAAIL